MFQVLIGDTIIFVIPEYIHFLPVPDTNYSAFQSGTAWARPGLHGHSSQYSSSLQYIHWKPVTKMQ